MACGVMWCGLCVLEQTASPLDGLASKMLISSHSNLRLMCRYVPLPYHIVFYLYDDQMTAFLLIHWLTCDQLLLSLLVWKCFFSSTFNSLTSSPSPSLRHHDGTNRPSAECGTKEHRAGLRGTTTTTAFYLSFFLSFFYNAKYYTSLHSPILCIKATESHHAKQAAHLTLWYNSTAIVKYLHPLSPSVIATYII